MTERFKVGDVTPDGISIERIIGQSDNCLVYCKPGGAVCIRIEDESKIPNYAEKSQRFTALLAAIPRDLEAKKLKRVREDVGVVLFHALESSESSEDMLREVSRDVERLNKESLRARFNVLLLSNVVQALLLSAILGGLYLALVSSQFPAHSLTTATGGVLGATLSLLQRRRELEIQGLDRFWDLQIASVVTVLTGALSGFFVYWAVSSDLVLGVFQGNYEAIFVFGVIAGFSERYFNSLIEKIA